MDKINHEPVPAKVIKYATLDKLPKYSWLTTPKEQNLNRMMTRATRDLYLQHLSTIATIGPTGSCSYKATRHSLNLAGRSIQKRIGNYSLSSSD